MRWRCFLFFIGMSLVSYAQDTTRLSLLFVGDIMQHDSNIAGAWDAENKRYNYEPCFQFLKPIVSRADVAIGNLELTLAGTPYKGYPQFSAPDELAYRLKDTGFDVLVTANNHCVDRGRRGLERTISILDTVSILHTGTFRDSTERKKNNPLIIEQNGFRLSLLNYTYGTNGLPVKSPNIVNLIDTVVLKRDLKEAKSQNTDAVMVFFHWGNEYQNLPNEWQKKLTKICFRNGAKLVIGSHPHVLQPIEWHKEEDQLIAYSLGNFISGQRPRYRDGGMLLWVELKKSKKDSISSTYIDKAEYQLEWMYKTPESKFFSLPVENFEADSTFIKEQDSRKAFELFISDSRALLSKYNVNVTEKKTGLDSGCFQIRIATVDSAANENEILRFYQFRQSPDNLLFSAPLFDEELANKALEEVKAKTIYKDAVLVRCRKEE